jgi:protein O-GlcNAc transferase
MEAWLEHERQICMTSPRAMTEFRYESAWTAFQNGRYELAVQLIRRCLMLDGPRAAYYELLEHGWAALGRKQKAREAQQLRCLLASEPHNGESAAARQVTSDKSSTQVSPRSVSDIDPDHTPFAGLTDAMAVQRADQLQRAGQLKAALGWCLKAIVLEPDDPLHAARAGDLALRLDRPADARALLTRAAVRNGSAAAFQQLGNLSQDLQDYPAARQAFEKALTLDPDYVSALCALGHLLQDQSQLAAAEPHLQRAEQLQPDSLVRIVRETALAPIPQSLAALEIQRQSLLTNLDQLIAEEVIVDPAERVVPNIFYAPYHGLNDRPVAERFGRIYRSSIAEPIKSQSAGGRRIRVGLLSRFFCRHTIGRLNLGTVQQLDRKRFEVVVIFARQPEDEFAQEFVKAADRIVVLANQPAAALSQLRQLELDILFFTDVGMDPFTYALAFSRSAPIQCLTWGHPVTTGSPCMDYFISSERLEVPEADQHYTEKLVRLPDLAVFYRRPEVPPSDSFRSRWGLSVHDHLYGCPQTLFKFHPEFDPILADILAQDPQGRLILIQGRHPEWTEQLKVRLGKVLGSRVDRVTFLPRLSWPEFMALTAGVDVLLDPIHFGGGNTTYEALAAGTPVVSLPGQYMRSRITAALFHRIGITETLVESGRAYSELAVRLGTDREYREDLCQRTLAANAVLFEDVSGIRQLETFWEQALQDVSQFL